MFFKLVNLSGTCSFELSLQVSRELYTVQGLWLSLRGAWSWQDFGDVLALGMGQPIASEPPKNP